MINEKLKYMNNMIVVGVAGGTGSGKSTFTKKLKQEFGDDLSILYYDNYYRNRSDISIEARKKINYDHPDALETDLLIEHLKRLKEGKHIECPIYNFSTHTREMDTMTIKPNRIIVLEGILTFQNTILRELLDLKIFVDSDADERILRRMMRDIRERGREVEDIAMQYITTVKPMHNIYVEPTKEYADIIIQGGLNTIALDVIISKLKLFIQNIK